MEPNVWKLFGSCALFLAGLIWFGIATIYEFKYQIPFYKVKPDYAEWKLKSARFLLRVCLIGSQVAGWLSLGVMVFVFLIYPGFMYSLEELHFDDMNQVQEDALLLMKVYVYGFSIFYVLIMGAIVTFPVVLWAPYKWYKESRNNHKNVQVSQDN